MSDFSVGGRPIGLGHPTYFIADIAANHDGSLDRALHLMTLAKEAGADCAKFQHFRAEHIVSDHGFRALGGQLDHQATWSKSVFEVYADASLPWEWTPDLARHGAEIGIDFMSAPYDIEAVDYLDAFMPAYKVGSGDVNWIEELERIASKDKPVFLATGAATLDDVVRAVDVFRGRVPLCLMQCNTNYTGSAENLRFVNLNVLNAYRALYPDLVLGLSDHTPGHVTVLGAVALGARAVEKHFTDDVTRTGPDHGFSMDPRTWREMVDATRTLESSLGTGFKTIEENELKTSVLQRRCVRAARGLPAGTVLTRHDLVVLRPAPADAVPAHQVGLVVGATLVRDLAEGEHVSVTDLG
jgi:sialic acid synthase SpsE